MLKFIRIIPLSLLIVNSIYASNFNLDIGLINQNIDFKQYQNNKLIATDKSNQLIGLKTNLEYKLNSSKNSYFFENKSFLDKLEYYIGIDSKLTYGNSDYISSTSASTNYGTYNSEAKNYLFDNNIYFKTNYSFEDIELYGGISFGSFNWKRKISEPKEDVYSWIYYETFIGSTIALTNNLIIGGKFKYRKGINGKSELNLYDQNYNFNLKDIQSSIYVIPIYYRYSNDLIFYFNTEIEKMKMGDSNILTNGFYVPNNESINTSYTIGLNYNF